MSNTSNDFYQSVTGLLQKGRNGRALRKLEVFLETHKDDEIALSLYGSALMRSGDTERAMSTFKHAVAAHPDSFGSHADLAFIAMKTGDLRQAKLLVKTRPDYLNYWILSRTFGHTGDHGGALSSVEKTASYLDTDSDELGKVDLLRGHALKILGRRNESESAYRACIRNTPNNGAGWWGLADLKTYRFSAEDKKTMENLCGDETANMDQRCQAAFALAKAFDNDGDHELAFKWYQKGNELRPDIDFSPAKNKEFCDSSIAEFDAGMLVSQADPKPLAQRQFLSSVCPAQVRP